MKKVAFCALVVLMTLCAYGQKWDTISASNASCVINACVDMDVPSGSSTASVVVSGTFTATLTVSTSADSGTNWSAEGPTITGPGTYVYAVAAKNKIKVQGTAYTTGSAKVKISTSTALAYPGVTSSGSGVVKGSIVGTVVAPQNSVVVTSCDSITSATETVGAGNGWADKVLLEPFFAGRNATLHNVAVYGTTAQAWAETSYDSTIHQYAPAAGQTGYFFHFCGVNDTSTRTPAQIIGDLETVWAKAKADGFIVIAFTIPRSATDPYGGTVEKTKVDTNRLIYADSDKYSVLIDSNVLFGGIAGNGLLLDSLHPNAAGQLYLAKHISRSMSLGGIYPLAGLYDTAWHAAKTVITTLSQNTTAAAMGIHADGLAGYGFGFAVGANPCIAWGGTCALRALSGYSAGETPVAYGSLVACDSTKEGQTASVTDSNTQTWGAAVAAGGSYHVKAYCNGTAWTVIGK